MYRVLMKYCSYPELCHFCRWPPPCHLTVLASSPAYKQTDTVQSLGYDIHKCSNYHNIWWTPCVHKDGGESVIFTPRSLHLSDRKSLIWFSIIFAISPTPNWQKRKFIFPLLSNISLWMVFGYPFSWLRDEGVEPWMGGGGIIFFINTLLSFIL